MTHNNDGVVTHLEPDTLECEVNQVLGDITTNKASEGAGIPIGLFKILKGDAVQLLHSVQFSSVTQSCPTLCNPMNSSTPVLPVHHQLPEFTQTHIHWVSDAIEPSHPLSPPSPPARNLSQHESLFQWVNSSHEVAKVLEFHL